MTRSFSGTGRTAMSSGRSVNFVDHFVPTMGWLGS